MSLRRESARRELYFAAPVVLSVGRWVAQERRLPKRQLWQTQGRSINRSLCSLGEELDCLGLGELAPPPKKSARFGLAVVLLQFEKAQEQIPQGGHDVSPFGQFIEQRLEGGDFTALFPDGLLGWPCSR